VGHLARKLAQHRSTLVKRERGRSLPAIRSHDSGRRISAHYKTEVGMTTAVLLVLTGTSSRAEAQAIVDAAITQRLAAAAQVIGPVASTYRWEGQLTHADEWLCLLKTTTARYAALEQTIRALHSYTLPGILALPVAAVCPPYLARPGGRRRRD
jgi:periplasmic divalent cation tolerance protein